jgi:hypothetical protein
MVHSGNSRLPDTALAMTLVPQGERAAVNSMRRYRDAIVADHLFVGLRRRRYRYGTGLAETAHPTV